MATAAVVLFALAALGGVTMATLHFGGKPSPVSLGVVHGLLAASGLVLLILVLLNTEGAGLGTVALVLFIGAALGGFVLFARQLRGQPWPNPLILIHGGVAATAFVLLLVFLYGS